MVRRRRAGDGYDKVRRKGGIGGAFPFMIYDLKLNFKRSSRVEPQVKPGAKYFEIATAFGLAMMFLRCEGQALRQYFVVENPGRADIIANHA